MDNNEIAKLKTLLNYWLQHNREHAQEFKEWAGKARTMGEAEAGKELLAAAKEMDKANESLSRALNGLK